ncbi:MAG TPA: asparagine synthase-related protein [Nostocaceae cyanobacterium]|nr:asparagine synthase-related protein [Nostocaceae cyanobacterium]
MQRLSGSYSLKSSPILQFDCQSRTQRNIKIEGWEIPDNSCSLIKCDKGIAVIYVSQPGEIPIYYWVSPKKICWSEQKFQLPKCSKQIKPGELIIWEPGFITSYFYDSLEIGESRNDYSLLEAFEEYKNLILQAVKKRLETLPNPQKVAVAQSGGLDSLLITWALKQLNVEIYGLTVCTSEKDLDFVAASAYLAESKIPHLPLVLTQEEIPKLLGEAITYIENVETSNVRMAMGNILMARKCQELGISGIFVGHGHDDIHGKGTLVKAALKVAPGETEAKKWANARKNVTLATGGMLKMFASTFRSYGINVRMPYYDTHLLKWAFTQPLTIIPIAYDKPFVRALANHILPQGIWLSKQHSVGYLKGSGLSLKQQLLKDTQLLTKSHLQKLLTRIKHENSTRAH